MRVIRYKGVDGSQKVGAITTDDKIYNLPFESVLEMFESASTRNVKVTALIENLIKEEQPLEKTIEELDLQVPIEITEVWASGVTYQKSKEARNYEATGGKDDAATFYDKVYDAERPEIFFKSTGPRVIGPNTDVYLRTDSNWQIPEPELGLVLNKAGEIIGYTIGNDMSSRDIEGENPLYLPQAKVWKHSCSIGPSIRLVDSVNDPYEFQIICRIYRKGEKVFEGDAMVNQLKRTLDELVKYLVRDNQMFDGMVLLTGTCIVPPNEFTLNDGDYIEIEIPGIGTLKNPVKQQSNSRVTTS